MGVDSEGEVEVWDGVYCREFRGVDKIGVEIVVRIAG